MRQSEAGFLAGRTSLISRLFLGAFACTVGAGGLTLAFLDGVQDVFWFVPVALISLGIFFYGGSLLRHAKGHGGRR
ncbi:MAG: hypothetical protein ACLPTF_24765 [Steroidobacteraceae bacterium]